MNRRRRSASTSDRIDPQTVLAGHLYVSKPDGERVDVRDALTGGRSALSSASYFLKLVWLRVHGSGELATERKLLPRW